MIVNSFVVSECGNKPEDAWGRAQAIASLENQAECVEGNIGVLHKDGFRVIGKIKDKTSTKEAYRSACNILAEHPDANIKNNKALCLDAGGGEYYFIGKAQLDK